MDLTKIRLLGNRVLIMVDPDPTRTASGLSLGITDDTERPKMLRATVLAAGPGAHKRKGEGRGPMDARVGMRVAVNRKSCLLELDDGQPGKAPREVLIVRDDQLEAEC